MIIIFGTTNERKMEDVRNIIKTLNLDIEVKGLSDISWDRGETPENGNTLEENSLIKALAIYDFCKEKNIKYPILTDYERSINPSLPKYECVNKLLRKLEGTIDRNAYYKCVVTCMYPDGTYFQDSGISYGEISEKMVEPIIKPYFYSVFKPTNMDKTFNLLSGEELEDSYRYSAFKKVLVKVNRK